MADPHLDLKPRHLRLISAIDRHGQLQLAADAVSVTRPAASRMLVEIERMLGASLFIRRAKGMTPTQAGEIAVARANRMLDELRNLAADLDGAQSGLSGLVRVGGVTAPAIARLVPAIRALKSEAPGVDIKVEVGPSRDLLNQLVRGDLDFVLARVLPEFSEHVFEVRRIADEEVRLLVRKQHPLADMPGIPLGVVGGQEWVMQERGAPIRETILGAFFAQGLKPPSNIVTSASTLFTLAYLAQTDAIAPISRETADLMIHNPIGAGFVALDINADFGQPPYYLIALRDHDPAPAVRKLQELVLAVDGVAVASPSL